MNKTVCVLLLYVFTLLLTACGGGGGTTSLSGIEGSGVAPNRITSAGEVTAKGSVFVNDVEYRLDAAVITIDGDPANEADLGVGSIVTVEANLDVGDTTGSARRVTAGIAVAGPISAVDRALRRITILGQSVVVDEATRVVGDVGDQPLGGLEVGDQVEVTAFADSSGVQFARRIAARQASTPLRLTGYVAQVDAANRRFVINGQTVDYSTATQTGFAGRALAGARVRVDADDFNAQGALRATEVVYREPGLPGNTGDKAALQGWVTRFASNADFDVDGRRVVTTSNTKVTGPLSDIVSLVRIDAFIEVKGRLIANGVVEASEIVTNNLISMDAVVWGKDGQSITANLWTTGVACPTTADTLVTIDGVASSVDAVQVGDVATIYELHIDEVNFRDDGPCHIVAVEHNVRGPLESKPKDSLSFHVMGQRVWLNPSRDGAPKGESGLDSFESLEVGDIVEVSGHTTAEGDILATGIHAGAASGPYRIIGLAREVSRSPGQFRLGNLAVDYRDAQLAGIGANGPAERDRVLVIADAPPSGAVLRADIVRFAGGLPRGATGNMMRYNGLVTRSAADGDIDLEGRRVVPRQPQVGDATDGRRCDMRRVSTNLSSIYMVGLGVVPGELARYALAFCPPGRRLDNEGPNGFGGASINVSGVVQTIDEDERVIRVGGLDMPLQPATRVTHFEASSPTIGVLTPMRLEDLRVGDRVGVESELVAGRRGGTEVWVGEGALPTGDLVIQTYLTSAAQPDLELPSGIRVRANAGTAFERVSCGGPATPAAAGFFWSATARDGYYPIRVHGGLDGDDIVAERIRWEDCVTVDAGPDQTVTAGTRVVLQGASAWSPFHWSQLTGPSVDLTSSGEFGQAQAEFVAPLVASEIDLVFILYVDVVDPWGIGDGYNDTVTIHVLPRP